MICRGKKVRLYFTPRTHVFILGVKHDRSFSEMYARVLAKNDHMQAACDRILEGDAENFNDGG